MTTFTTAVAKTALAGFAAISIVGAVPAWAATFINVNDDANFVFGGTDPGTSATLYLQLTSVDLTENIFTFSYTLENTSDDTLNPTGSLRSFGFNDVGVTTEARGTTATNAFGFDSIVLDNNFPDGLGLRDLCVHDGVNGSCNGGSAGLEAGDIAEGTFFLDYAGSSMTSLTLDDFVVRYQSLGLDGEGSGTGTGEEIPDPQGGPVPEPSTWAMMLLGFGAVGFAMRRRRAVASQVRYSFS